MQNRDISQFLAEPGLVWGKYGGKYIRNWVCERVSTRDTWQHGNSPNGRASQIPRATDAVGCSMVCRSVEHISCKRRTQWHLWGCSRGRDIVIFGKRPNEIARGAVVRHRPSWASEVNISTACPLPNHRVARRGDEFETFVKMATHAWESEFWQINRAHRPEIE